MDILKWHNKYSTDIRLVYNSEATKNNYKSQVLSFLNYFKNEIEPKSIDNEKIKLWLLQAVTINSRKHRLCALNSFYKITVGMPLKTLILILISGMCYSQTYLSVGADIRNGILGSEPTNNKPAFDGIFRFGMIGSIPSHSTTIECSVGYESFKRIQFDRYIVAVGVHLKVSDRITIVPSWEGSLIGRWGQTWQNRNSHLAILGGTVGFRYKISDTFTAEFLSGLLDRVDLNTRYGGSNVGVNNSITLICKL